MLCFFYESVHNNLFLVSPTEITRTKKTATKEKNQQKTQCYYKRLINKKQILFVVTSGILVKSFSSSISLIDLASVRSSLLLIVEEVAAVNLSLIYQSRFLPLSLIPNLPFTFSLSQSTATPAFLAIVSSIQSYSFRTINRVNLNQRDFSVPSREKSLRIEYF